MKQIQIVVNVRQAHLHQIIKDYETDYGHVLSRVHAVYAEYNSSTFKLSGND